MLLGKLTRAGVVLAALLWTSAAFAAVTVNNVVTAQTPNRGLQQFVQGTDAAGTYKTIYTGGANGSKCNAGWMTNNDASVTHLVTLQVVNTGGTKYGGVALTSVVNAGFANGAAPQSLMSEQVWGNSLPLDSDGNPYITLANGDTLQATFASGLSTGDQINLEFLCSDY